MDLNRDAMLVGLHISAWSGRLYDREASDHVAVQHDASTSAGRYNKRLLPKSALAAINAVMSEARTRHYANTLPWDDKGSRLLTVANYEQYTGLMDGLRERLVRQRARFIEDYDHYVEQARIDLGKLFRIEDYPSKDELRDRFSIQYRITAVPDADHFIASLASEDTEQVKRDIERHVEEQLHSAVDDLYRRLAEAVERVSERLDEDGDGKPLVFRDTMISNIRDLVDVVPRLVSVRSPATPRSASVIGSAAILSSGSTFRPSTTWFRPTERPAPRSVIFRLGRAFQERAPRRRPHEPERVLDEVSRLLDHLPGSGKIRDAVSEIGWAPEIRDSVAVFRLLRDFGEDLLAERIEPPHASSSVKEHRAPCRYPVHCPSEWLSTATDRDLRLPPRNAGCSTSIVKVLLSLSSWQD